MPWGHGFVMAVCGTGCFQGSCFKHRNHPVPCLWAEVAWKLSRVCKAPGHCAVLSRSWRLGTAQCSAGAGGWGLGPSCFAEDSTQQLPCALPENSHFLGYMNMIPMHHAPTQKGPRCRSSRHTLPGLTRSLLDAIAPHPPPLLPFLVGQPPPKQRVLASAAVPHLMVQPATTA